MNSRKWLLAVGTSSVLALGVAACGDSGSSDSTTSSSSGGAAVSGEIAGAGSSAQEAAQEAWIAGVQDQNPDLTISYDPVGSGGGREQFNAGGVDYAGSDSSFADEELTGCGEELRRRRELRAGAGVHLADRDHLQPAGRH